MYLETCTIRNIKCFEEIELKFGNPDGSVRLWNVIIGENGTGKTTLLKAIAIALLGETSARVLQPYAQGWARADVEKGEIRATIVQGLREPELTDAPSNGKVIQVNFALGKVSEQTDGENVPVIHEETSKTNQNRLIYGRSEQSIGWFAAGYGSFRRLTGGEEQSSQISRFGTREARFVTLFREEAALRNTIKWLTDIDYASRDEQGNENLSQKQAISLRNIIFNTLNNFILLDDVQIKDINARGIFFRTPYADEVPILDLSDGYRSLLSMTLDLMRQFSDSYKHLFDENWRDKVQGVVLIDELDAHLHPKWQRQISSRLRKCFPHIQFIVTTHSPFIPQAADEHGLFVLRADPATGTVRVEQDEISLRGWRADQILTGVFGLPTTRDVETEAKLARYDTLLAQKATKGINDAESQELTKLEQEINEVLPPPGDTTTQRDLSRRMQEYIAKTLAARNGT